MTTPQWLLLRPMGLQLLLLLLVLAVRALAAMNSMYGSQQMPCQAWLLLCQR